MTIDLSLDSRLFIRNELDAGVQELDLLLNTTNTELINYPQFGTDFEQFLWQLNPAPQAVKKYIDEKIRDCTLYLRKLRVNTSVDVVKGEYRMIYNVIFNISDEEGNNIQRKYQFR